MDNFLNIPGFIETESESKLDTENKLCLNNLETKSIEIENPQLDVPRVFEFDVNFPPTSLKRHRHTKFGNHTYDPSAGEKKEFLKKLIPTLPKKPLGKPIKAELYFYELRPKSHYRTGKYSGELKQSAPKYNVVKKDIDNFVKFVFDSLNKHLYNDDSQIFELICGKYYSDREYSYICGKFAEVDN